MFESAFFRATSLLIGTMIGAGIFGIPYVTARSGYLVGLFWLVALTVFTIIINLVYVRVILSFQDGHPHQLIGYGKHCFGRVGELTAAGILLIGYWGALIAYIAGMGQFLAILLGRPGWGFVASIAVFVVGTVLISRNLRTISEVEGIISLLLVVMILLLGVVGFNKIELINLFSDLDIRISDFGFLSLYGVIFGSLSGWAVLPEIITILRQDKDIGHPMSDKTVTRVILAGVVTAAAAYAVFQFTVVGISGAATSEEAIIGLVPHFAPWIIRVGALFGLLAMGTSFLALAYSLRDMFDFDFNLKPVTAVLLTMLPPLIIFLLGLRSFIRAFEFTGIWIGTLSGIFIFLLYLKSRAGVRQKTINTV